MNNEQMDPKNKYGHTTHEETIVEASCPPPRNWKIPGLFNFYGSMCKFLMIWLLIIRKLYRMVTYINQDENQLLDGYENIMSHTFTHEW